MQEENNTAPYKCFSLKKKKKPAQYFIKLKHDIRKHEDC